MFNLPSVAIRTAVLRNAVSRRRLWKGRISLVTIHCRERCACGNGPFAKTEQIRPRCLFASIVLACGILGAAVPSTVAVTRATNNVFGSYDVQPDQLSTIIIQGNTVGVQKFAPHSGLALLNGVIRDDGLKDLLVNNLGAGDNRTHDSLLIAMSQCFSGGFIDEIEDTMNATMITTSAAWNKPSLGSTKEHYFPNGWATQFSDPPPGNLANDTKMKAAYSAATVGDPQRNKEKPQYYATSNFMDDDRIGSSPDKQYALLFVADDRVWDKKKKEIVNVPSEWNAAALMYKRLTQRGYTDDDIHVYYADYDSSFPNLVKPVGAVGNLPIDGPATKANFDNFFNNVVGPNVVGRNDQVFVWTAGHGADIKDNIGKIQFEPIQEGARIAMQLELGQDSLLAMTSDFGLDDAVLSGDPITNFVGNVDVFLGDANGNNLLNVGTITDDHSWSFDISRTVFDVLAPLGGPAGFVTLSFLGSSAGMELNNFSLASTTPIQLVPEPTSLVLFVFGLTLLTRGVRRFRCAADYLKNWPVPTGGNASLKCSIVGRRALSGQVMATTSKRAAYCSRPWDLR